MTYGAYFFDFDLTLADSREGITKCFRGVLSRHGFTDVTDDAIVSTVGHSMADSFTLLTGETDPVVIEGWRHEFRVFSERWMNTHTYLFPETAGVLAQLRGKGAKLAVISQKTHRRIALFFEANLPAGAVDLIVGGDDVKAGKPDPEGLLFAAKTLGVHSARCLYCGDTVIDAEAARRAGMDFAAVLHGTTPAEAFAAYPVKRILKTLDEIREIDA